VVRQDVHHFTERAIEHHLENLGKDKLTEVDKDYLERNSLLFMFKALRNLKL
jgi:hypothetical protein